MLSIKDVLNCQQRWNSQITSVANGIDSKLISVLSYEDMFSEKYNDNKFKELYEALIEPMVKQYNQELNSLRSQYLIEYLNDMAIVLDTVGVNTTTGEEISAPITNIPYSFIPCAEVECVYNFINELKYSIYEYRPFWSRGGYHICGNNEYITTEGSDSPCNFILNNRNKFIKSYGEHKIEVFKRSVLQASDLFDYDIHVQPMSRYDEDRIPNNYNLAVRRHLILKHALENEKLIEEHSRFISKISIDGDVLFTEIG
ncbi:hypothetical protein [Yersinia phage fHe-Yen9-03]|uniref:Uncharacterized protein n=1 Tax=Yersinia phage fHe-Yen9-03 TaxID=2052743 RepID=A0A2C9CYD2_9CAUD|nr:hypothetical protein [Yersinia phage fHe-Yen9-03]